MLHFKFFNTTSNFDVFAQRAASIIYISEERLTQGDFSIPVHYTKQRPTLE